MGKLKDIQKKISKLPSLKYYEIEDFVKFDGDANIITKELGNTDIKTAQLRKFFAKVKEIELQLRDTKKWDDGVKIKFYSLMSKLAYAKGRDVISERFFDLMKITMIKVGSGKEEDTYEDFIIFVQFLESIVAFYKFNHPKSQ